VNRLKHVTSTATLSALLKRLDSVDKTLTTDTFEEHNFKCDVKALIKRTRIRYHMMRIEEIKDEHSDNA